MIAPPAAPPITVAHKAFLYFIIKPNMTGSVTPISAVTPVDKPSDFVSSFFAFQKMNSAQTAIAAFDAAVQG